MTPASTMTEMLSVSILAVAAGLAERDEAFEPTPTPVVPAVEPDGEASASLRLPVCE